MGGRAEKKRLVAVVEHVMRRRNLHMGVTSDRRGIRVTIPPATRASERTRVAEIARIVLMRWLKVDARPLDVVAIDRMLRVEVDA